jgi:hypothetical protein
MAIYDEYTTERVTLERRTLVGPMTESRSVLRALHDDGWHTTRSGAYTDRDIFPSVDVKRFLFIAEREITSSPCSASSPAGS